MNEISVVKKRLRSKIIRRDAFTLAEVLITLGVIGVVAALTLPIVINNYQKQETISKIKKVNSVLSNVALMAIAEHGDTVNWDMQSGNTFATSKFFAEKYVIPYLNVAKVCENNNSSDCNYSMSQLNGQSFNNYSNYKNAYRFYLTDGTFLAVFSLYRPNGDPNQHIKHIVYFFDINGPKKPNIVGRDIFALQNILETKRATSKKYEGKLLPVWIDGDSRTTLLGTGGSDYCNKKKTGLACLAVIYMDGFKIKSDYPW